MTDHAPDRDARAQLEAAALARVEALQGAILELLNKPEDAWIHQPRIAAHALAETLGHVLAFIVTADRGRAPWALELVARVADHVEQATNIAAAPRHGRQLS